MDLGAGKGVHFGLMRGVTGAVMHPQVRRQANPRPRTYDGHQVTRHFPVA